MVPDFASGDGAGDPDGCPNPRARLPQRGRSLARVGRPCGGAEKHRRDDLAVAEPGALVPALLGAAPVQRTFVLVNNTGLGGEERRFGRLFDLMADAVSVKTLAGTAWLLM